MSTPIVPAQPANSFRIAIDTDFTHPRMDNVLLDALRNQDESMTMKNISRGALKNLFNESKIFIKGQRAKSNSSIAKGITYVDIMLN